MKKQIKLLLKKFIPNRIILLRRDYYLNKQRDKFHKSCKELLELTDSILREEKITYWLNYGTLLGAYRDNAFIKHDYDLDVAILGDNYEQIKRIMTSRGMKLKNEFRFGSWEHPENIEYRFEYKGAYIDFNFYWIDGDKAYTYCPYFVENTDRTPGKKIQVIAELIENPFKGTKEFSFLGRNYYVPIDIEAYLIANYGPDYKVPVKDFDYHKYASNIHQFEIDEKISFMYIYY